MDLTDEKWRELRRGYAEADGDELRRQSNIFNAVYARHGVENEPSHTHTDPHLPTNTADAAPHDPVSSEVRTGWRQVRPNAWVHKGRRGPDTPHAQTELYFGDAPPTQGTPTATFNRGWARASWAGVTRKQTQFSQEVMTGQTIAVLPGHTKDDVMDLVNYYETVRRQPSGRRPPGVPREEEDDHHRSESDWRLRSKTYRSFDRHKIFNEFERLKTRYLTYVELERMMQAIEAQGTLYDYTKQFHPSAVEWRQPPVGSSKMDYRFNSRYYANQWQAMSGTISQSEQARLPSGPPTTVDTAVTSLANEYGGQDIAHRAEAQLHAYRELLRYTNQHFTDLTANGERVSAGWRAVMRSKGMSWDFIEGELRKAEDASIQRMLDNYDYDRGGITQEDWKERRNMVDRKRAERASERAKDVHILRDVGTPLTRARVASHAKNLGTGFAYSFIGNAIADRVIPVHWSAEAHDAGSGAATGFVTAAAMYPTLGAAAAAAAAPMAATIAVSSVAGGVVQREVEKRLDDTDKYVKKGVSGAVGGAVMGGTFSLASLAAGALTTSEVILAAATLPATGWAVGSGVAIGGLLGLLNAATT